jgi:hypothetical protein
MKPFSDFLKEVSPTIEEDVKNSLKSFKKGDDLESIGYLTTAATIVLLRRYHEWLTEQLS